jgi:hypothetical protein
MLFYSFLGGEMFWGFVSGMKGHVVQPLLAYVVVRWYTIRRFPAHVVVAAILILILLVPINLAYRDALNAAAASGQMIGTLELLADSVGGALEVLLSPDQLIAQAVRWYSARNFLLLSVALIARAGGAAPKLVPLYTYFILPVYPLIPRALWSSKPVLDTGRRFAIEYMAAPEDTRNSVAIGIVGDALLWFGRAGVFLWPLLVGIAYKFIYRWFVARPSKFRLLVYGGLLLGPLRMIESTIPELVGRSVQAGLFLTVIGAVLYGGRILAKKTPVAQAVTGIAYR